MSPVRTLAAAITLAMAAGCALTHKAKPLDVTYYTPAHERPGVANRQATAAPAIRLGRVVSGTDLGDRIVYGDGAYQVRYYDGRRWTERPEMYVRQSLTRTLFEESGFRRALTGEAPTLDVEVLTFQEVKTPSQHAARIALRFVLAADRVLLQDTLTVTEPVTGDRFDDVVAAIARALDKSSNEVSRRVASVFPAHDSEFSNHEP